MPPAKRAKREQRGVQKRRASPKLAVRKAFFQHFKKYVAVYVPLVLPLIFFFLAQFFTLFILIFMKFGVLGLEHLPHRPLITWSFFGLPPLLLCSYGCFFAVARSMGTMLSRQRPHWPPALHTLVTGTAYGVAIGLVLSLLLEPETWLIGLFLFGIGMATGLGNWFLYRQLTAVGP